MMDSAPAKRALTRAARRVHGFNMIEVVLALGVLAVGIVTIVALFPAGLSASRDSIAESYAADSADQFLHFYSARLKDPVNSFASWDLYGKTLPKEKPDRTAEGTPMDPPTWTWQDWYVGDTTKIQVGGANKELYRISMGAAGSELVDFSAVYRVWREDVLYSRYDAATSTWVEETISDNIALAINIEISWPTEVPYDQRQKALYHKEVFKSE